MIRYGDQGAKVEALCNQLVSLGHLTHVRTINGPATYDHVVRTTIKRIQKAAGVKVDGIVGPVTQRIVDGLEYDPAVVRLDYTPPLHMAGCASSWKVLQEALDYQERGAREVDEDGDGHGNNEGPWVRHFLSVVRDGTGDWCGGFVSRCAHDALGDTMPIRPFIWVWAGYVRALSAGIFRYTPQGAELAEMAEGKRVPERLIDDAVNLRPGDAFIETHFTKRSPEHKWKVYKGRIQPGHVGLVHHREEDSTTFYTIEGNVGRSPAYVGPQQRDIRDLDILGYWRWE